MAAIPGESGKSLDGVLASAKLDVTPSSSKHGTALLVFLPGSGWLIRVHESRTTWRFRFPLASFDCALPRPPRWFGRRRALQNLLRATYAGPYLRALSRSNGAVVLRAQVPLDDLSPALAWNFVAGLERFAPMRRRYLARDSAWREPLARWLPAGPPSSTDVEGRREAIGALLRSERLPVTPEPDGAYGTDLVDVKSVRIAATPRGFEIATAAPPPPDDMLSSDEVRLSLLLRVNEVSGLSKVALSQSDDVVLLFEVPELTEYHLWQAESEFASAIRAIDAINEGRYRPDPLP